jgi:class 3 adenylate cyclase
LKQAVFGGRLSDDCTYGELAPAHKQTTVMFADIVDSTEMPAEFGDHKSLTLLSAHNTTVREELRKFHGRFLSVAGDGFLAAYGHPAQALECAHVIRNRGKALGLRMRIGVHGGPCLSMGRFWVDSPFLSRAYGDDRRCR